VAAEEVRYLLNCGYSNGPTIRFVSDHHRLSEQERFVLTRVVISKSVARSRRKKLTPLEALRDRDVFVDGYNVLITVESLLAKAPVYLCDDGFLRDTRGIFRNYKSSELTDIALAEILALLKEGRPRNVTILFDQQMSKSGLLASNVRDMLNDLKVTGSAKTAKDVDRRLKSCSSIVATADGNVIDAASNVVDLPAEVARRRNIKTFVV